MKKLKIKKPTLRGLDKVSFRICVALLIIVALIAIVVDVFKYPALQLTMVIISVIAFCWCFYRGAVTISDVVNNSKQGGK